MVGNEYRLRVHRQEAGAEFALVEASVHSQRSGQRVRLACQGLPRVVIQAAIKDSAAWPTNLVLTVRRFNVAGAGVAMGTPTTISGVGVVTITDQGGLGDVEVVVTTPSSADHARVRIGITAGRA